MRFHFHFHFVFSPAVPLRLVVWKMHLPFFLEGRRSGGRSRHVLGFSVVDLGVVVTSKQCCVCRRSHGMSWCQLLACPWDWLCGVLHHTLPSLLHASCADHLDDQTRWTFQRVKAFRRCFCWKSLEFHHHRETSRDMCWGLQEGSE